MRNITFRLEKSSDGVTISYKYIKILAMVEWAPHYGITLHKWVSDGLERIGIDTDKSYHAGQCIKIIGVDNYEYSP